MTLEACYLSPWRWFIGYKIGKAATQKNYQMVSRKSAGASYVVIYVYLIACLQMYPSNISCHLFYFKTWEKGR